MEQDKAIRSWSGSSWEIAILKESISIKTAKGSFEFPIEASFEIEISRRWFRWFLNGPNDLTFRLTGISRYEARLIAISGEISALRLWSEKFQETQCHHRSNQVWIPKETIDAIKSMKPSNNIVKRAVKFQDKSKLRWDERQALEDFELDLDEFFYNLNEEIIGLELESQKDFLATIEKKPLSAEQARAVITMDNRVLLVAAAGSGKTSVMVARAAYAVKKGLIAPPKILLLAYNASAAKELQFRVEEGFKRSGIDPSGIVASTFHAFGLGVLGKANNERPKVASWVENGTDLEEISKIVSQLKRTSPEFGYQWDLYRLIFTPDTLSLENVEPDAWDSGNRETGFRTFDGKIVKSHGERMIANWLYLHGVKYEYEREYRYKTSDSTHRQYIPDFYYPDIETWHEHWALDINGEAPKDFIGYQESMNWKRHIHKNNKTKFIETTFGEVVFADGLSKLRNQLVAEGIKLDWNPERPKAPYTEIENKELVKLIRTFMAHVKSNSLNKYDIEQRLKNDWVGLKSNRTELFLDIYWPIHEAWERNLRLENAIDFEDMLVKSAEHIEDGAWNPDYDLILLDEFQDTSAARGRLTKSLLQNPGKYVLAVGDDWQSINRFAGSDITQMTNFNKIFGQGPTLFLSNTYRSTQLIADVASKFVMKNKRQLQKTISAQIQGQDLPVTLIRTMDEKMGVAEALKTISQSAKTEMNKKASVYVLGRYRFNNDWLPDQNFPTLDVTYKTIHSSKGLEADYVVLVNLESGRHGFPSEIEDDPVLNLAMSTRENFLHAEERRLLYVALTRAKKQVFLVTRQNRDSQFAIELMVDEQLRVINLGNNGKTGEEVQLCKVCKKGFMTLRTSKERGNKFLGCSNFPRCTNTMNIRIESNMK